MRTLPIQGFVAVMLLSFLAFAFTTPEPGGPSRPTQIASACQGACGQAD